MTDSPIQPGDFSEELLSGYLDGELSSEEQALVENALNRDPQVQQLLDELQQLRQCLQELPQEQPQPLIPRPCHKPLNQQTTLPKSQNDQRSMR